MKVTPAAAAVPLLLLLLTWLSTRAIDTDAELFDRALAALDQFAILETTLDRDVLSARAGLLRNYDPLVREVNALRETLDRLRETAAVDAVTAVAIDRLAASVGQQEAFVEQFKSNNALLQNSLAYFELYSVRFGASGNDGPLVPAVSALAIAMLHFTLDTSSAATRQMQNRLNDIATRLSLSSDAETIGALLAHGRLLSDLLPATDGLLKALLAAPSIEEQGAVRAIVLAHQQASRATARWFRLLLYATSLLLLGILTHLGLRLRRRTLALRQRAAFEHLVAGISTRFIDVPSSEIGALVEQALARLAEFVGADRAYFVLPGAPARVHAWCRKGTTFPPDWPDRAVTMSTRLGPVQDGIIHVPHVDRLRPGVDRDDLAAAGLQGWVCVAGLGKHEAGVLGFDALRPGSITVPGELGLLRMARNAVANAIRRDLLEKERTRLKMRLEQARRLETVGALASGIAHNFNNFVGAIQGYAEMAEAELAADSPPVSHLREIRRVGKRASALVDQIMAFGRHRDAIRRPLSVRSLVADAASLLRALLPTPCSLVIREVPGAAVVSGSCAHLQQAIVNLCNNAAQAMGNAGRIEVETCVYEIAEERPLSQGALEPGRYVCIAVSDSGRGMDEVTIGRIFEPFFTTRVDGNGLGLATVREIVREHAGTMNVESTLGVGSRFEVWLPCIAPTEPAPGEPNSALFLGRGETLVVIDGNRELLLRHEEMLAALGYEPIGFTGAGAALAACRATPKRFDAMVIGHLIPISSVFDLAAALREIAPGLPILLAMASADGIGADALMAAGISEIVHRPLISAEIAAALTRCLAVVRHRAMLPT
jgi:signal transduction histidine kinase